jgi:hypothetical protein
VLLPAGKVQKKTRRFRAFFAGIFALFLARRLGADARPQRSTKQALFGRFLGRARPRGSARLPA